MTFLANCRARFCAYGNMLIWDDPLDTVMNINGIYKYLCIALYLYGMTPSFNKIDWSEANSYVQKTFYIDASNITI